MLDPVEIYATAEAVARELGDGWAGTDGTEWGAYIVHNDGRRILLDAREDGKHGRWVISGRYPDSGLRYAGRHSIGAGFNRSPSAVAAAIRDRLLDDYSADFARVAVQLAKDAAEEAGREAVAEQLLTFPGARRLTRAGRPDAIRVNLPGYGRAATVIRDGSLVSFELAEIPADLAVRIVRYILAELPEEGTS